MRVPNKVFKTRENDEWVDKTTQDYFFGKRVLYFRCLVHLHLYEPSNIFQGWKNFTMKLLQRVLTKFTVCVSMMHLS